LSITSRLGRDADERIVHKFSLVTTYC
jgi:hypothetical protein